MKSPRQKHIAVVHKVMRYLNCTGGQCLFFSVDNNMVLRDFCDSDWGGCPTCRKSVTGYYLMLGSSLVSWQSKKQSMTYHSTTEAEYWALATTTCEVLWLHILLQDLHVSITGPTPIYCDNKAAIDIAANHVYHAQTKHIEIDCHFVREKVQAGVIQPLKVSSKE